MYVLICALLGYAGGITNYFSWYRIPIPPFLNLVISVAIIGISYAIIRHHLLDIEVVIKRTLVFAGLAGFVLAMFTLVTVLARDLLAQIGLGWFWANLISTIFIISFYRPIEKFLVNLTDRFLFQKKYDSRQVLMEFADEVITKLNLSEIVNSTLDLLVNHVRIERCAIFLLNTFADRYEVYGSKGMENTEVSIPSDDRVIQLLKERKDYVLKSVVTLPSELVMPFFIHDELIGFLALGKKKSDEEYTQEDLDTLSVLARTVTIAISNARMSAQAAENEKRAAIGTLAAGINHEIRNPLNIMKTKIDAYTLKLDKGLFGNQTPEELVQIARKIMEVCNGQIERIAGITEKLSNFAQPSKELKPTEVHIADELKETLEFLEHELKLDQIRLQVDIPSNLPGVLADKNQMRQIFFNLIRNAAQAIEGSGQIGISAKAAGNGKIQIEISDTGCGIAADKLDKIFVPFYTTKEPGKGTGLGLSVVRQLVWSNRGEISVKSKVGEGTTFTLEFPIIKG